MISLTNAFSERLKPISQIIAVEYIMVKRHESISLKKEAVNDMVENHTSDMMIIYTIMIVDRID